MIGTLYRLDMKTQDQILVGKFRILKQADSLMMLFPMSRQSLNGDHVPEIRFDFNNNFVIVNKYFERTDDDMIAFIGYAAYNHKPNEFFGAQIVFNMKDQGDQ